MRKPFIDCVIPYPLCPLQICFTTICWNSEHNSPKDMDYITVLTVKPQTFFVPGLDKTPLLSTHLKRKQTSLMFSRLFGSFFVEVRLL